MTAVFSRSFPHPANGIIERRHLFCQLAVHLRMQLLFAAAIAAMTIAHVRAAETTSSEKGAEDAHAWLQRMSQALATRNYDGRFLHLAGGHAENMRIIHRVANGAMTERLVSLDGSGREVIRTDSEVTCYLPDRRTVLVERRKDRNSLLSTVPANSENLQANYMLAAPLTMRVLGRTVQLITVQPRDNFRYGYRLWLDKESAMPLKSQLCDHDGRVLEQVIFSDLRFPDAIGNELLRTSIVTDGFQWIRQDARTQRLAGSVPGTEQNGWVIVNPPTGFRLTATRMQSFAGNSALVRHMVFSDGLASVSVFIEPLGASRQEHSRAVERGALPSTAVSEEGLLRVGTAFAFTIQSQAHRITAIGEAPAGTVQAIATAVRPEAEPNKLIDDVSPDASGGNRMSSKTR